MQFIRLVWEILISIRKDVAKDFTAELYYEPYYPKTIGNKIRSKD